MLTLAFVAEAFGGGALEAAGAEEIIQDQVVVCGSARVASASGRSANGTAPQATL